MDLHCWSYSSMPAYATPTFSMSHPGPEYALLGVNQQLRNEAGYALFTSTTSVAQVGAPSIQFPNKSWLSADWDRFQQRLYCTSSACNLPVTMAKRIRNIKIHIGLGAYGMGSRDRPGKLTVQNHTEEDAGLYAVRANVRKLVDMTSCTDANGKQVRSLQDLTITVHGNSTTCSWPQDKGSLGLAIRTGTIHGALQRSEPRNCAYFRWMDRAAVRVRSSVCQRVVSETSTIASPWPGC
jgi:hypothetical protein